MGWMDSSFHVWTDVSVKRGIIWGISVHNMHMGEVLIFFSGVHSQLGYYFWDKGTKDFVALDLDVFFLWFIIIELINVK